MGSLPLFQLNREFKKLRRLLHGKRHFKIKLCVRLSVLRLFHVGHLVQNMRSAKNHSRKRLSALLAATTFRRSPKFFIIFFFNSFAIL